jgi:hypothetical protein
VAFANVPAPLIGTKKPIRELSNQLHLSVAESAIMKKAILLTLATAWLVAPAMAAQNTTKDMTTSPPQQNGASTSQAAPAPGSAAAKQDDKQKGLSRNSEDCNKGCIGTNGQ